MSSPALPYIVAHVLPRNGLRFFGADGAMKSLACRRKPEHESVTSIIPAGRPSPMHSRFLPSATVLVRFDPGAIGQGDNGQNDAGQLPDRAESVSAGQARLEIEPISIATDPTVRTSVET